MICNKCGADTPDKAAFCPQCGAQLKRAGGARGSRPAKAARIEPKGDRPAADAPEEELWTGTYSPKAMTGAFVGLALLTAIASVVVFYTWPAGMIVVGLGTTVLAAHLVLSMLYQRLSIHYRLTTHRLVIERGILSKTDDRILLVDIDDITVRQGLIDRMLDIGTVVLNTSDATSPILTMRGIENPRQVGDMIDEARRAERSRRGVYMMNA
jgi:membrane protein YdbS with pleckstrin-like domain